MKNRGHVLICDLPASRRGENRTLTPRWVYDGNYSRDEMIKNMNDHIEAAMRRCGAFKADSFYEYVPQLCLNNVPVDAVGLQCHLVVGLDNPDAERIEKNFARFHALGVKVYVTELDVRIPAPVTDQKLAEQARLYSLVINTALRSPSCAGLTAWG